jgi:hypothetical protein
MGLLGMYPVSRTGYKVNPDDVLAECAGCGRQKMMTREFVAITACIPTCYRCNGNVWLWIREGYHQIESQAPRIEFRCEGKIMPWSKG